MLKHLLASPSANELVIFALVRSDKQFEEVKKMGAVTPLRGDLSDGDALRAAVEDNKSVPSVTFRCQVAES